LLDRDAATKIQSRPPNIIRAKARNKAKRNPVFETPKPKFSFPAMNAPKKIKILPINQKITFFKLLFIFLI